MVAACRHHVVGGVLEPGPQAAGQTGVETGPGRRVAPQEGQDLTAGASIHRRVALGGGPVQRAGGDEDHSGQCAHWV